MESDRRPGYQSTHLWTPDFRQRSKKYKKEGIFNKWCWHNWISTCRRIKIDPYLSPCIKLKSKWIKDLNIKPATLNLIEEKVGSTLESIGTGDHFLNITPAAQTLRAIISGTFWNWKAYVKQRTQSTRQSNNLQNGLISKIYKEIKKFIVKRINNPIKKWSTDLNREHSTEESKMVERHLRKCSTSFKTTRIPPYTCNNGQDLKCWYNLCWKGCGEKGTLLHCW